MQTRLVAAVVCLAGCEAPAPVPWQDLPVPAFVVHGSYNGTGETRVDNAVGGLRDRLRDTYGPIDIANTGGFWPVDTLAHGGPAGDWSDVDAFYEAALGAPGFAGFARDTLSSDPDARHPVAVWHRETTPFGTPDVLGVLFVSGFEGAASFVVPFSTSPSDP